MNSRGNDNGHGDDEPIQQSPSNNVTETFDRDKDKDKEKDKDKDIPNKSFGIISIALHDAYNAIMPPLPAIASHTTKLDDVDGFMMPPKGVLAILFIFPVRTSGFVIPNKVRLPFIIVSSFSIFTKKPKKTKKRRTPVTTAPQYNGLPLKTIYAAGLSLKAYP